MKHIRSALAVVLLGLLISAIVVSCDVPTPTGLGCSPFDEGACNPPAAKAVTCGFDMGDVVVPGTGLWITCNIPTSAQDPLAGGIPVPVSALPPCDTILCVSALTTPSGMVAAAQARLDAVNLELTGSVPIECNVIGPTVAMIDDSAMGHGFSANECVTTEPKAPCAPLGDKCNVMLGPQCCAPNMCDVLVAPAVCCLATAATCSLADDQCCSTDVCEDDGDGPQCCHQLGSLCNPNVTFGGCCEADASICALANNGITYVCQ